MNDLAAIVNLTDRYIGQCKPYPMAHGRACCKCDCGCGRWADAEGPAHVTGFDGQRLPDSKTTIFILAKQCFNREGDLRAAQLNIDRHFLD